jgi:hypothetical protein
MAHGEPPMDVPLDWNILIPVVFVILCGWIGGVIGWFKGGLTYIIIGGVIGAMCGAGLGWFFMQHLDWFGIKLVIGL